MSDVHAYRARHETVRAIGTCTRCGDFFCEACRDGASTDRCARCTVPIGFAWEGEGRFTWRLSKTLQQLASRPSEGFPGPERVGPALQLIGIYVLGSAAISVARSVALELELQRISSRPVIWRGLWERILWDANAVLLLVSIPTLLFWLATRGAARASWRAALRAAALAVALDLFRIPLMLLPRPRPYAPALWEIGYHSIWCAAGLVRAGEAARSGRSRRRSHTPRPRSRGRSAPFRRPRAPRPSPRPRAGSRS